MTEKNENCELADVVVMYQQPLGVNLKEKSCMGNYEGEPIKECIPVHVCYRRMTTLSVLIHCRQHPWRLSKVIAYKTPNLSYIS